MNDRERDDGEAGDDGAPEDRPATEEFLLQGPGPADEAPAGPDEEEEPAEGAEEGAEEDAAGADDEDEAEAEAENKDRQRRVPANELNDEAIERYAASAKFTVGLIGFPTAGKTFLLNRLKYSYARFQYDDGRTFDIQPPYDTRPVGRTTQPTYHLFTRLSEDEKAAAEAQRAPEGSDRDFVIFDLPGELFERAVNRGMRGPIAARLSDAIAACDALILVLPSELLFGSKAPMDEIVADQLDAAEEELERFEPASPATAAGEQAAEAGAARRGRRRVELERKRETERLAARRADLAQLIEDLNRKLNQPAALKEGEEVLDIERKRLDAFVSIIANMVARVATMKRLGIKSAEMDAMSMEEQGSLISQTAYRSYAPLIYVAISKADALLSEESPIIPLREELAEVARDDLDRFPFQATAVCEQAIYQGITSTFRWYKFDFLTAFEGQSHNLYGSIGFSNVIEGEPIRYDLREYGVTAIIDWLEFAKRKANALKRRGVVRWAAALGRSAPEVELGLARRAELRIAQQTGFRRGAKGGWLSWAASLLLRSPTRRVAHWFIAAAALLGLVAIVTTGIAEAAWTTFRGDAGGYSLTPQPRYASEVERLREGRSRFARGFVTGAAHPWSQVPSNGRMFAVPEHRRVRAGFTGIIEDLQQLPASGSISPTLGRQLIGRLNGLQADMNTEYAADSAGEEAGLLRERPFINYHVGYVQLRMRDFDAAAESFANALRLLRDANAVGRLEEGRLLGVEIATHYARGLALMESGNANAAEAALELDAAREMLPGLRSSRRILLTPARAGMFFDFDPARTPASVNTANLWADSLAAHIRAFNPALDLGPDRPLSRMVDELSRHKQDIPRDHPLAANYLIAGALLGRPLSEMRMAADQFPNREQQEVARTSLRSLGHSASFRVENDIWAADQQIRAAFMAGDADQLRRTLDQWTASDRASEGDRTFLRDLAGDIVSTERLSLPREQRGPLLSAFGEYVRGAGFFALANDLSRAGGLLVGLLIPLVLLLLILRLWVLYLRSRETFLMLTRARHRLDRRP